MSMQDSSVLSTITGAQTALAAIYTDQNGSMTGEALCLLLLRRATTMFKLQRKGQLEEIPAQIAENFAWLSAIATRFGIDLGSDFWHFYPGVCPYCRGCGCNCTSPRGDRKDLTRFRDIWSIAVPSRFDELQKMLKRIYPANTLADSMDHFVQEAAEVGDEVGKLRRYITHGESYPYDELRLELADGMANLFAFASCAELSVGAEVGKLFQNGCPWCHNPICECGPRFTIKTVGTVVGS